MISMRLTRLIALGMVALLLAACTVTEEQERRERELRERERTVIADAARPAVVMVNVDFSPLFERLDRKATAYFTVPSGTMDRIMVSPNIVLPPSQASHSEVSVLGEVGTDAAPVLRYASGRAVSHDYAALLLRTIYNEGSRVFTPVMLRRYHAKWWDDEPRSFVERVVEWYAFARDELRVEQMPSAILGVQEFEYRMISYEVAVIESAGGNLRFELAGPENTGYAETLLEVRLPTAVFSAEVIDPTDGTLIARLYTHHVATPPRELLHHRVERYEHQPVRDTDYAREWVPSERYVPIDSENESGEEAEEAEEGEDFEDDDRYRWRMVGTPRPIPDSEYEYIANWTSRTVYLERAQEKFRDHVSPFFAQLDPLIPGTRVLEDMLKPLFQD